MYRFGHRKRGNILNIRRRRYNRYDNIIRLHTKRNGDDRKYQNTEYGTQRIRTTWRRLGIIVLIILAILRYLHSYTTLIGRERVNGGKKPQYTFTIHRPTNTVPPQQTQFTTFHLDSFIIMVTHYYHWQRLSALRAPHSINDSLIRRRHRYHHHRM